ncbi:fungal zn binuclear cluster domain containing protein [Apiospora arundinis]|uniref:Fungal zn binuclear cluster domain containing protein n=1 Tax=Apiospora arundinis TaxID=335852 RepID=A0ABR2J8E1_9PEZI
MASVASASPAGSSFQHPDSADESESWQYIESNPGSVAFFPSPASGSLNSWGLVNYPDQLENSSPGPDAVSPLQLNDHYPQPQQQQQQVFSGSYTDQANASMIASAGMEGQYLSSLASDPQLAAATGQDFMFNDQYNPDFDLSPFYNTFPNSSTANMSDLEALEGMGGMDLPQNGLPIDLDIPQQFRDSNDVAPWDPTNLKNDESAFAITGLKSSPGASSCSPQTSPAPSSSSQLSLSPQWVGIKPESTGKTPIRRTKGTGKIEKKRSEPVNRFVIMTPNLINASAGKPNPYECFDAMRTTARGRKGPLANDTKENALQVRRQGACFCCHSRKVKCDKERPCKNCKKLTHQLPQIVCWQFQDFLPVLFPDFIRSHFKKDQMAKFISENVDGFTIGGSAKTCTIELFSGHRFQSTLTLRASFFTAKSPEVLQHWHLNAGVNSLELESRGAVPIGIDLDNTSVREDVRRKARDYVQALIFEPQYAEQVTDSVRHTELPRKILRAVQIYGQRSDSPIVKKALSIYAMHYVLTRHLCITHASMAELQSTNLVPRNIPWVTPRLLNRQVKAMLDEHLLKEVTTLFEGFSKSLKPKSRTGWAPCLAAFLVLCLFMESVETAADVFVVSQNEVDMRNNLAAPGGGGGGTPGLSYKRAFARAVCREIENMPFKQFAYQFHQVYQTHSRDASTKPFNPLLDDSFAALGELDAASLELVTTLKGLLQGDSYYELDFLVADPILPNEESHPYPRDVSASYTGRLVSRFLLSFLDEKYLFDGQY